MPDIRTCTVMRFTDGKRTIYSVMRGQMKGRKGNRYFDAGMAETVGTFDVQPPDVAKSYAEMTSAFAMVDAPPVDWQR